MRLLLVEDDENKRDHIRALLMAGNADCCIDEAGSYQSALKHLLQNTYSLLLLDMTLPTFDKGGSDSAGRLRPFGGEELLDQMQRRSIAVPVVVVTGYDILGSGNDSMSLDELRFRLKQRFPQHFHRAVFYSRSEDRWQADLQSAIESIESSREST
jgi:CheY-like chemotaxis protein